MFGYTEQCTLTKKSHRSQIPGLRYYNREILDVEFPIEWAKKIIPSH